MAAVSAALAIDGASSFVVLLVVLLAMMLVAVIRLPRWDGSSPEDANRPLPAAAAQTAPARPLPQPALPRRRPPGPRPGDTATMPGDTATMSRPAATAQARYAARHGGTIPRPAVSSGPPWGPAPKPPGIP